MSGSSRRARVAIRAALLALVVSLSPPAPAGAATLRIKERTLNALMHEVGTLRYTRAGPTIRIKYYVPEFWGPFIVGIKEAYWTVCSGNATNDVASLAFALHEGPILFSAELVTRYCGQRFEASISGIATARMDATGRNLLISVATGAVRPDFIISLPGWLGGGQISIPMPFTIDIGPAVTLDPIPARMGRYRVETAHGSRRFEANTRGVVLDSHENELELGGGIRLW